MSDDDHVRRTEYPPVLLAEDVAEFLGMHIDSVRRLSREGVLPTHRLPGGRTYRYVRDELLAWVQSLPADGED